MKHLLISAMLLSVLAFSGCASEPKQPSEFEFEYNEYYEGYFLVAYNGDNPELVVPAKYKNQPVIGISSVSGTNENVTVSRIVFPDSIKTIQFSFSFLTELEEINLPNSLEEIIGSFGFQSSITTVDIPDSLKFIDHSFTGENFTHINVGEGNPYYSSIDGVLFNKDKTELWFYPAGKSEREYVVPDSVTRIGLNMFMNGDFNLTKIKLSAGFSGFFMWDVRTTYGDGRVQNYDDLQNLGNPFSGCAFLEIIEVDENNQTFTSIDGILFSKDEKILFAYPPMRKGSSYTVPYGVEVISHGAFLQSYYDKSGEIIPIELNEVTLPSTITKLGPSNFLAIERLYIDMNEADWNENVENWLRRHPSTEWIFNDSPPVTQTETEKPPETPDVIAPPE
ncbi:MAG: leucine-rich repeat domain-containing protein [Oscillospiraceae bacterium]|nr:leucine-rich repeat domain-containing protein [Oscillospiraceae bacterium]